MNQKPRTENKCCKCEKELCLANGGYYEAVDEDKIMCIECYHKVVEL